MLFRSAVADTAVAASVNAGFTAFDRIMRDWQAQLIRWRCGLSAELRKRAKAPENWNCRDLKISVNRVGFEQLGTERARALNAVDTRFKLPAEQVDFVIDAGRDALRANPIFQDFINHLCLVATGKDYGLGISDRCLGYK